MKDKTLESPDYCPRKKIHKQLEINITSKTTKIKDTLKAYFW